MLPAAFMIGEMKINKTTLEQQIQQTEQKITYLEHQQKIKQHEAKQLDRKRRNHRVFTRGGMLESFLQSPLLLGDAQVYQLLQTAFNTPEVKAAEQKMIAECEQTVLRETKEDAVDEH